MSVRRLAPAPAVLALVAGLAGCTDPAPEGSSPEPSPSSTPLSARDLEGVTVGRTPFCGELAEGAPDAAVGGEVSDSQEYESGERVEIVPGTTDVAHEHSCGYTAEDGSSARAWVFAPVVTPRQARGLAEDARATRGCRALPDASAFGEPSVALACRSEGSVSVSYRGLFADAWLVCEVGGRAGPGPGSASGEPSSDSGLSGLDRAELRDRAEGWCGAVIDAASR